MAVKSKIQQFRKESRFTQADLANEAGISRQAYTAIESGKSVPSTEIALRLARALKVRVEDLFELDDADNKTIEAELIGGINSVPEGTRVQLVGFGSQRLARPLTEGSFTSHIFNPTDAIALSARGDRRVELKLLNESAVHTTTLLLAGSDPATSILAQMIHDTSVRLIWVETESIASLRGWRVEKSISPVAISAIGLPDCTILRWSMKLCHSPAQSSVSLSGVKESLSDLEIRSQFIILTTSYDPM